MDSRIWGESRMKHVYMKEIEKLSRKNFLKGYTNKKQITIDTLKLFMVE